MTGNFSLLVAELLRVDDAAGAANLEILDPAVHRDEVPGGMFVGWVHAPAALVWGFGQGHGRVVITTFRLAPESGPLASTMLDSLIERLAAPEEPLQRVPES